MAVWLPSDENILKDQLKERARITDKVLSVKKFGNCASVER